MIYKRKKGDKTRGTVIRPQPSPKSKVPTVGWCRLVAGGGILVAA